MRIGWLFNHLVGTDEQCGPEGDAQRPGGLEVEDEIELRRLLYRSQSLYVARVPKTGREQMQ